MSMYIFLAALAIIVAFAVVLLNHSMKSAKSRRVAERRARAAAAEASLFGSFSEFPSINPSDRPAPAARRWEPEANYKPRGW